MWAGPFNGFQAAVGLLLLSVTTPAALAEDRARGSLELLLSTPISTRSLGAEQMKVRITGHVLAGHAAGGLRSRRRVRVAAGPESCWWLRWFGARRGRDQPGNCACDLELASGPSLDSLSGRRGCGDGGLGSAALFEDTNLKLGWAWPACCWVSGYSRPRSCAHRRWIGLRALPALFWIFTSAAIALGLLWATLVSFDWCVGRIGVPRPNNAIHLPVSFK